MSRMDCIAFMDHLLEAIWLVDPLSQQIVSANAAAARLQQLDPQTLPGTSVLDLSATPEDLLFWEALRQGERPVLHSETLLRRQDGATVRVLRRATPLQLPDGRQLYLVAMQDRTQQHQTEQKLEELLAELRATLESTADGILVCDLDGRIRAFNRLFAQLWSLPEHLLTQKDDGAVYTWLASQVADPIGYQRKLGELLRSPLLESTDVLVLQTGRVIERIAKPQLARGRPIGRVHVFRDITERTAAEAQLKLAAKVFESSLDAIFITDPSLRILTCNPAAAQMTQSPAVEWQGRRAPDLFYSPTLPRWKDDLDERLQQHGYWEGEFWFRRPDQCAVALQASWVVLKDPQGQPLNTILFVKDLSERLAAQQRIEQLAYTDALTGLPNRLMLTERVNHAIHVSQRNGQGFAVLFLDLDRFKSINDSLGHLFGDMVLIEIASRLKQCLRQTDTLCRLGGDEFVIHLHDADTSGAEITAQRIIEAVTRPVEIEDMSFNLSCSVGIAMYPSDGQTLDELIQHADTAMYQVKDRGKGHYRFYRPQMNADLLSRIQLDHAMREGLKRQEFVLHYQPRVCMESGELRTCEALVRWNHPERGLVLPGEFITVAEETGFIVKLGQWVLQAGIAQAAAWARQGTPCQVAINVSALQFQQASLVDEVAQALQQHGLPAHLLELELTESILIHDAEEALARLQALADLGVHLSLDDFGTGYSSLTYLKRFPLHKLKIDRTFIASLHEDETDAAIVSAIIQMGHALQMQVVAEGVEQPEQHQRLRALGCDHFQGFLFSPAVPAQTFSEALQGPGLRYRG
ncbi:diguanylate cyclase/phosphodiesterase with PAS/PAC sensor(s) [Tepidicella xavieri]|uniref:Diguanylate cyclase/phosphodiesterase with PAS/PAC sensor(S) n=2 Tax=Tepidicella xavieri TaxID=360241 RepID=A0A4R6UEM1_9BURK|nr:diguanylate cyclase/phosphodiesterase with PAS/PAC sensor(s) [Tepidicella xavieri]